MKDRKKNSSVPKVDMDNLYGSWKYPKITTEHVTRAIAKMNKDHDKIKKSSDENQDNGKSSD